MKIQEKKQVDNLNTWKPIKDNKFDDDEKLLRYKEIFDEISNERMSEIQDDRYNIDFNKLTYYFTTPGLASTNFATFKGTLNIYDDIENGNILIDEAEEDQEQFK